MKDDEERVVERFMPDSEVSNYPRPLGPIPAPRLGPKFFRWLALSSVGFSGAISVASWAAGMIANRDTSRLFVMMCADLALILGIAMLNGLRDRYGVWLILVVSFIILVLGLFAPIVAAD
jgi:hypothetical protein